MYFIEGVRKLIQTQYILAQTQFSQVDKKSNYNSWLELKNDLNIYLESIQPRIPVSNNSNSIICTDSVMTEALVRAFNNNSILDDLQQNQVIKYQVQQADPKTVEMVSVALDKIKSIDTHLYDLLTNTLNYIFFSESGVAGGGSSSAAIGCIWLNPRSHWSSQDVCELLVHELTHNLLFLDERRFRHYNDYRTLKEPQFFAQSSILKRPRPLDKVVHSFVVASEVLSFRKKFFSDELDSNIHVHPTTTVLLDNLGKTYFSLINLPKDLLTDRAWELIEKSYTAHNEFYQC